MIVCLMQSLYDAHFLFPFYFQISNKTILQAIESEFSGDVKNGMLAIG